MSDSNQSREEYIEEMKAAGYVIVYPEANELQIDIDNDYQLQVHTHQEAIFFRNWPDLVTAIMGENHSDEPLPKSKMERSKSGQGWHVTYTLPFTVTPLERIAFQAALGSDPARELLSLIRYQRGDNYPTLFVEKPTNG